MDWMSQLGGLLQQYAGQASAPASAHDDFDQMAQHAPQDYLADGLAAAFRSNQTPAFGDMVANLFANGSGEQKAGLLNMLAPLVLQQVVGGGGGNNPLAALLGSSGGPLAALLGGGNSPLGSLIGQGAGLTGLVNILAGGQQVTPEMADKVSPEVVRRMAEEAQQRDPSIIDTISNFYAEHPTLVKTLGAVALSIALNRIASRR